jgi:hypothetical protein
MKIQLFVKGETLKNQFGVEGSSPSQPPTFDRPYCQCKELALMSDKATYSVLNTPIGNSKNEQPAIQ